MKAQLLDASSRGAARAARSRPSPSAPSWSARAVERARDGGRLTDEEVTALLCETRPEAIEAIREAADELRAELAGETVTFVVNRNINVSNVCVVGCAFCGFGQGKRSPDAYEHSEEEFRRRVREAAAYGATELCLQSGIHPDWGLEDYERWLRVARDEAARAGTDLHLHAYSPMEVAHMCDVSGLLGGRGLRPAGRRRPGVDAGHRRRGAPRRGARAHLARTSCRWRAGWRSSRPRTAPGCARPSTVMFGHVEEPWELAVHLRVVRELQERTGGITEFVPLSFIPFQTLLGRTHGVEEITREENLKHTAVFRLALGRSIPSLQASWVKMGLDAATEALSWGVNDLGGTLMEESISRLAGSYHGVRLDPPELIAAAHRAGRHAAERTTLYDLRRRWPAGAGTAAA